MPEAGDEAPDFALPSDEGTTVTLSSLTGHRVLVYFYPKDDTPGCTAQACDLRDELPRLREEDVVVLGLSPDSPESHRKFRKKYDLGFTLLSDEDHGVAESYGVWKEKSMFGKTHMGIERSSFLVDEEGRIERVWRKVDARKHLDTVLAYLES